MERDPRAYLWDIQQAVKAIFNFTSGFDFSAYMTSDIVRAAVERKFEIIGEAMSQLSKTDPAVAGRVPDGRAIIGFRNQLIHRYSRIDHAEVWAITKSSLPELQVVVTALLDELGPP